MIKKEFVLKFICDDCGKITIGNDQAGETIGFHLEVKHVTGDESHTPKIYETDLCKICLAKVASIQGVTPEVEARVNYTSPELIHEVKAAAAKREANRDIIKETVERIGFDICEAVNDEKRNPHALTYACVSSRIRRRGFTLNEALSYPKERAFSSNKPAAHVTSETISDELAKNNPHNFSVAGIRARMNRNGWPLHKAITTERQQHGRANKKKKSGGIMDDVKSKLADYNPHGFTANGVCGRINNFGWSIERAIMTPRIKPPLKGRAK